MKRIFGRMFVALTFVRSLPLRFWVWLVRQRMVMGIAGLLWFLYRTGLNPRRMAYPCQQAALAEITAIFGGSAIVGLFTHRRPLRALRRAAVAGVAVGVFGIAVFHCYYLIADSRAVQESTALPLQHLADEASYPAAEMSLVVQYPSDAEAVVAVRHAADATYGTISPYDKASNPAYQLVWDTVAELGFGPPDNPLRDLVSPGDSVTIKPNLESDDCTQAATVRPVIDMCLAAGAAVINVGDSSGCGNTQPRLDSMGYTSMINTLRSRGHTQVRSVTFTPGAGWSWVNLGSACAYSGSGYTKADLANGASPRFNHTDSHGVNPGGQAVGWNTISDYLIDVDVVINMPKLKVHDFLVGTFAIKNWVGAALHSTTTDVSDCTDNISRVCHWGATASNRYDYGFGNDFMWREMANLHRATIYWKNGAMQPAPQRKYLVVCDALEGVDYQQHGTKVPIGVAMASVDPIAINAVAERLMQWDFRYDPLVANATLVPSHSWGTNDPARIRVVGNPIGTGFGRRFTSNNFTPYTEHTRMQLSDLEPPEIVSVDHQCVGSRLEITATTDADAAAAFLYYGDAGIMRMAKNGSTFTVRMTAAPMDYSVVVQDRYFNWRRSDTTAVPFAPSSDVNSDGKVNVLDLIFVRNNMGRDPMSEDSAARSDANADGKVNILDLLTVRNDLNH